MLKKFLIGTLTVVAFVVTANLALASYDFGSATLKVGSRGQYVTTLQNLVGATPIDGFFGPKTKAKVVVWQMAHDLIADGLFGPVSKAKANETGTNFSASCTNASGFSTTTGLPCSSLNANTFPVGCTNASGFSITTGLNCLNNLPPIRGGGSSGSSHHDTSITAIGAITGTLQVGQVLTAGTLTPSGATVSYQWQIGESAGGVNYPNIEGATSSTYTILASDVGKYFDVTATGTGSYSGSVKSAPTTVIEAATISATVSTIASGTLNPSGIVITLTGDTFTGEGTSDQVNRWTVNYGTTGLVLENYGSTFPIVFNNGAQETFNFHGTAATGTITIKANATALTGGVESNQISITVPAATIVARTSGAFTTTTGNNTIAITLTGGTFKAGTIIASDFTFTGTDASAIATNGTFTRTSDTIVTITDLAGHLAGGVNNTVLVKAATQATQASSVAGVASTTILDVTSAIFTTTSATTTITITLAGGTFKAAPIVAADFTFGGPNATAIATNGTLIFNRTDDAHVVITDLTGKLSGVTNNDNTVTVLGATQATQAASVSATAS